MNPGINANGIITNPAIIPIQIVMQYVISIIAILGTKKIIFTNILVEQHYIKDYAIFF